MERIAVKVYAALWPADARCAEFVRQAGAGAVQDSVESWLFHAQDLLSISFEGLYFPEHEVLTALAARLPAQAQGKMDMLDLTEWELRRYVREKGVFRLYRRTLDHVLEYAGH